MINPAALAPNLLDLMEDRDDPPDPPSKIATVECYLRLAESAVVVHLAEKLSGATFVSIMFLEIWIVQSLHSGLSRPSQDHARLLVGAQLSF